MSGFELPPLAGDALARWPLAGEANGPQDPVRGGEPLGPIGAGGDGAARTPFAGALADAIERVQTLHTDVQQTTRAMAMGENVELHDLMMKMGKSEVAFHLMLEVRNKLVDAWERLSRAVV